MIEHAAVWTSRLEEMKAFYTRYFDGVAGDKYVSPRGGGMVFESYFLSFGDGARLELMQMSAIPRGAGVQATGLSHIALGLENEKEVRALVRRLKKDGVTVAGEPRRTGDGYYEASVCDPDGNLVEITVRQAIRTAAQEGVANFLKHWFGGFGAALDQMDDTDADSLLAQCGLACSRSYSRQAFVDAQRSGDEAFFSALKNAFPEMDIETNGNRLVFIYRHCACDLVKKQWVATPRLCACSRSSLQHNLESVRVELTASILAGADCCRLEVTKFPTER